MTARNLKITLSVSAILFGVAFGFLTPVNAYSQSSSDELRAKIEIKKQELQKLKEREEEIKQDIQDNAGMWGSVVEGGVDAAGASINEAVENDWWWTKVYKKTLGRLGGSVIVDTADAIYQYFAGAGQKQWSKETNDLQAELEKNRNKQYQLTLEIQRLELELSGASTEELQAQEAEDKEEIKTNAAVSAARLAEARKDEYIRAFSCNFWSWSVAGCALEGMAALGQIGASISAALMDFSKNIFNASIDIAVTDFYKYATMKSVDVAWSMVRDLVNLSFIFILLYIAISVVLESFLQTKAKSLVVKIVVVALLVNFSAVIPKVVIDVSNIFAIQINNALDKQSGGDIASTITRSLHLEKIGQGSVLEIEALGTFAGSMGTVIAVSLGKIAFFLIMAFVFFVGAYMFIFRTLILIILIITSPIYFVGFMLPELKKHTEPWLSQLLGQAFFAPILLFLLLLTVSFVTSADGIATQINSVGAGSPTAKTLIFFIIVNGMLMGSFLAAKALSNQGSSFLGGYAGKLRSIATAGLAGGAIGITAATLRNTVGRSAGKLANTETLKNLATKKGPAGFAARMTLKTSQKASKSSFDARNVKSVGKIAGLGDIDLGKFGQKAGKGGYQAKLDKQIKAEETLVKDFSEEQKQAYAETLERRGRFGLPYKWVGAPAKRQKAANKIGDLKEKRRVAAKNIEVAEKNGQINGQIEAIKNSAVYVNMKNTLEREVGNLRAAERALANALEQKQGSAVIDSYRKDIEAAQIKVKQATNDMKPLKDSIKKLEESMEKPVAYKKKDKSEKEKFRELKKEVDEEEKESKEEEEPKKEEKK